MQTFEIFRPGKQTSSNGLALEFSEELLRASAEAYDPAIHEAPIVIGHPKDNGPAWGWIKSTKFDDGLLFAEPDQVDPTFAEMVQAGRFKKRSASFYTPDSPANPVPGVYYLRHVGFLGAQPPAVKGLKDVAFSDADEGVVEFYETSPYIWNTIAGVFRSLREWIIADKGLETADKMIPNYTISELEGESKRASDAQFAAMADIKPVASFNEPAPNQEETDMDLEQIKADLAASQARVVELEKAAADAADFAEKAKDLEAREQALARKEIEGKVDGLIGEGKVLPANRSQLVDFMASLQDAETVVEFGEGDQAEKFSQRAYFEKFLASLPKAVEFREMGAPQDGVNPGEMSNQEIADKAVSYQEKMKAEGITISTTEAVAAVRDGKA